jgi:RNA polymerase sigma-70 factor (ECF subfamily)
MYVKIVSLVLILVFFVTKIKLSRLDTISWTNNVLIYEPNRVLQITALFKDKVFRLAKRLLISTEEAEDATKRFWLNYGEKTKVWLPLIT